LFYIYIHFSGRMDKWNFPALPVFKKKLTGYNYVIDCV